MRCVRVFVFVLLLIFTAAATCSSLFPLYRKETGPTRDVYYYWYHEVITKVGEGQYTTTRLYSRNMPCDKMSNFLTASGALAAGGAAFGGIATLMSLSHIYIRPKCCLCFGIMFMCFLAFGCFTACVGLTATLYTNGSCPDSVGATPKLKDSDYDIVEGFGLMCAAAGGFLITMLIEICA